MRPRLSVACGLGIACLTVWFMCAHDPNLVAAQELPSAEAADRVAKERETHNALTLGMLRAATGLYEHSMAELRGGQTKDPEAAYRWSRRWLEAEQEITQKPGAELAAARAHLQRMTMLEEVVKKQVSEAEGKSMFIEAANFYRIEAERSVIRAESEEKSPSSLFQRGIAAMSREGDEPRVPNRRTSAEVAHAVSVASEDGDGVYSLVMGDGEISRLDEKTKKPLWTSKIPQFDPKERWRIRADRYGIELAQITPDSTPARTIQLDAETGKPVRASTRPRATERRTRTESVPSELPGRATSQIKVFSLKYARAASLSGTLQQTFAGRPTSLRIVPEERTNSLLVTGSEEDMEVLEGLIQRLDQTVDDEKAKKDTRGGGGLNLPGGAF